VQTVVNTLAAGEAPVPWANLATQGGLAYGTLKWLGYPGAAKVAAAVPVAVETVAPKVASRMLLAPPGAGFRGALPQAAAAAAPWASGTVRLVPQVAAPFAWPAASTLTPAGAVDDTTTGGGAGTLTRSWARRAYARALRRHARHGRRRTHRAGCAPPHHRHPRRGTPARQHRRGARAPRADFELVRTASSACPRTLAYRELTFPLHSLRHPA